MLKALEAIWNKTSKNIVRYKFLYLLGLPGLLHLILFKYMPMYGILVAFQDYSPIHGFWSSEWVGLDHFKRLFTDPDFYMIFRNSLMISVLSILFLFPAPILLALLLNEVNSNRVKRAFQTIVYLPHFLSWVVVTSLSFMLLSSEIGLVNKAITFFGGQRISFLMDQDLFYPIILLQGMWKDIGWGTIIYLAAIAGVDQHLYEAAKIDGAGRFKQIKHVTIPSIVPTIMILFILNLGSMIDTNFEQLWLMMNPLVTEVAEVFDTYVYKIGLINGQFSYSTAIGLFKSVIGLIMVLLANYISRKKGYEGIW